MSKAKTKPGRPALPPEKKRDRNVMVRLSSEEIATITRPHIEKRLAEIVRELALKAAKKKKNPS